MATTNASPAASDASPIAVARLDRAWLEAAVFPVITVVDTRFADVDLLRHVNNVAAVELLQEGRAHLNRASGLKMIGGALRTMVVGLIVEYGAEVRYPGAVEIRTGVLAVGRSSLTLGQVALQDDRPALYAQATLVMTDAQGPTALPTHVRSAYEQLRIRPC